MPVIISGPYVLSYLCGVITGDWGFFIYEPVVKSMEVYYMNCVLCKAHYR